MTDGSCERVLLGIGNPLRGDDAAGRIVARMLRGKLPRDVTVVEHDGEAATLLSCFQGVAAAFLVDACTSGAPAGTIRRFDVGMAPLPCRAFGLTTHGFGLAEAVELARTLGRLPQHCIVYAIEGVSFDHGAPLSPAVGAAVTVLVRRLGDEIARASWAEGGAHA